MSSQFLTNELREHAAATDSPPAAGLGTEPAGVFVTTHQVDEVVEHGDAHVGHARRPLGRQAAPLRPAGVVDLEALLVVVERARGEHAAEGQHTVKSGARLRERALHDRLPQLLAVVAQGVGYRLAQWAFVQTATEALQHVPLHQAEAHGLQHPQGIL